MSTEEIRYAELMMSEISKIAETVSDQSQNIYNIITSDSLDQAKDMAYDSMDIQEKLTKLLGTMSEDTGRRLGYIK